MSEDLPEIVFKGTDFCKHLVSEGLSEFETNQSNENRKVSLNNNSTVTRFVENNVDYFNTISFEDHSKVMSILSSKLLFAVDIEYIERILLNCSIHNNRSNFKLLSSMIAASVLTFVKRDYSVYVPLTVISFCSISLIWQACKALKDTNENKSLSSYIANLQNLSINIHKTFQFLKENEVISTGKVSNYNVSAAMYMMPFTVVKELKAFPPWKTLPHVRKCLAEALLDSVNILLCACNSVKQLLPAWMTCYSSSSQVSSKETLQCAKDNLDGCIPIKDLQLLIDAYLLVQSECLRWIALCFCSVGLHNLIKSRNLKSEVFKILKTCQYKLSELSFKLKAQFSFNKIFLIDEETPWHLNINKSRPKELYNLQGEVKSIFLLILSITQKIRDLEDLLEKIASSERHSICRNIKELLTQQLSVVRNDLTAAIARYDNIIYQQIDFKKEIKSHNLLRSFKNNVSQVEQTLEEHACKLDYDINSTDEVFVSKSGFNSEKDLTSQEDWYLEKKPEIPRHLLTELSTTLEPIKRDFKERERLALDRSGLKDIENDFDGDKSESIKHQSCGRPAQSGLKCRVKSRAYSDSSENDDEIDFVPSSKSSMLKLQNKENSAEINCTMKPQVCHSIDPELASVIAMKSKAWRRTAEECFTDE